MAENIELRLSSRADLSGYKATEAATTKLSAVQKKAAADLRASQAAAAAEAQKNFATGTAGVGKMTQALSQSAAMIDSRYAPAVGRLGEAFAALGSGGAAAFGFGVIATALDATVQYVIKWYQTQQEISRTLKEENAMALDGVLEKYKSISDQIAKAANLSKELANIGKGEAASDAQIAIHELHIATLQKITDDMTASAKAVILADEALQAAKIKYAAAEEQARLDVIASKDAVKAAEDRKVQAAIGVASAEEEYKGVVANFGTVIKAREELQKRIKDLDAEAAQDGSDSNRILKELASTRRELAEFELENKDAIDKYNAATKKVTEMKELSAQAVHQEEIAVRQSALAEQNLTQRRLERTSAEMEASNRLTAAKNADEQATIKAVEQATIKAEEDAKLAQIKKEEQRIVEICNQYQVETQDYLKLYNTALKEGATQTEIFGKLQEKLNADLKKRQEAEAAEKNAPKKKADTPVVRLQGTVRIDPSNLGQGVDKGKNWQNVQKQARIAERAERDAKAAMQQDIAPMVRWLKGNMTDEQKKLFEGMLKTKYLPDQVKELGKMAMNKELLSKKEQQEQQQAILKMADEIAKSLRVQ